MELQKTQNYFFERLKKILKSINIETDGIEENTTLESFLDSIDIVEVCIAIEQKTNSIIGDDEMESWENVSDILKTFQKHTKE